MKPVPTVRTSSWRTLRRRSLGSLLAVPLCVAAVHAQQQSPSLVLPAGNSWSDEGPAPNLGGQSEGIVNNPVSGAINSVAAHPTDANILYIGAVNGGIWRTTNATNVAPTWERLTSSQSSQSIGTVEFDPTDASGLTLLAGIGRFSSFAGIGGSRSGLLRTTNGVDFTEIDGGMAGRNISGVAARGSTLVAAVDIADTFSCANIGIWRSTNTGTSWTQVTTGIPRGAADALASDPSSTTTLYASLVFGSVCTGGGANGIYKSTDTGASWSKVSNAAMDALLPDSSGTNVDIVVGNSNNVFVAIVPASGQFGGIFRSGNGGGTWQTMDLPSTFENTSSIGAHPGGQGGIHTSIAADPSDPDVVYVGGDRQPLSFGDTGGFPNSIGAVNFSGRLFRGDAGLAPGSQWTPLTHSDTTSNSAPHADSRDMVFDANGNLIETDDGGIVRRTSPAAAGGNWFSINGNLQVTEQHDIAVDSLNNILIGGNQDNASSEQTAVSGTVWTIVGSGDGGDVAAGPGPVAGTTVRFSSSQTLQQFRRRTFNSSNTLIAQAFPGLAGASIAPQFKTPLALNEVVPNRLILGGGNGVFESLNGGDTISLIGGGAIVAEAFQGGASIAAGGLGNANMLYVAGCIGPCTSGANDGLFRRTTNGGSLSLALASSAMVGTTIDPDDASHGFALETGAVHRTINSGASFTNVTGNLLSLSPGTLRTIEYINSPTGDGIVVGTDRGVFLALDSDSFSTWAAFGAGIPNTPAFELNYDAGQDALVVGTLGTGAFRLTSVSDECAESISLPAGIWRQISLVCNPGLMDTVADVFGDDLGGTYATDWIVFERDANTQTYLQKALTDSLSVGTGYWIRTNLASQVVDNSGTDNPVAPVALVTDSTDGAGCGSSAGRCNMVGTPHAFDVCWADVEVIDGASTLSLGAADPGGACQSAGALGNGCVMSRIAHKWTGSSYAPFDGITPGLEGTLNPWDGIWVSGVKAGAQLRVPAGPGSCGPPVAPSAPGAVPTELGAQGWFIRLIAESGSLQDSSNVLGLLPDSVRGYDSHDLPELPPFGNSYLTIVFPRHAWGAKSGDYTSEFRKLRHNRWLERWLFTVRSSDPNAEVTLRWEGDPQRILQAELTDRETEEVIRVQPNGSYTFTMNGNNRSFFWKMRE